MRILVAAILAVSYAQESTPLLSCSAITMQPFDSLADFAITKMLEGQHLTIGLRNMSLFSEHVVEDGENNGGKAPWRGFDVAVLQEMAVSVCNNGGLLSYIDTSCIIGTGRIHIWV
jgi:hypothetical protein